MSSLGDEQYPPASTALFVALTSLLGVAVIPYVVQWCLQTQQTKEEATTIKLREVSTNETEEDQHEDTWLDRHLDHLRHNRLSAPVEFAAAWTTAFACMAYYGIGFAQILIETLRSWTTTTEKGKESEKEQLLQIPLMTEPRLTKENLVPATQVYQELREVLHQLSPKNTQWTDANLVQFIRTNERVRRLVSRLMTACPDAPDTIPNYQQLVDLWPQCLRLPPVLPRTKDKASVEQPFDIGLIIPAYAEQGHVLARTVHQAWIACCRPERVTVVIVDCGNCTNLDLLQKELDNNQSQGDKWGKVRIVSYKKGGGRGPTLNYGALCAHCTVYTFLHADTLIPTDWDVHVWDALVVTNNTSSKSRSKKVTHACSFLINHDLAKMGLGGLGYPWGIRSVTMLTNIRTYFFKLPYGDHILAFPSAHFDYVGGFPAQPLMEDYELMDLMRRRAACKPLNEQLQIVGISKGAFAGTNVRRWQSYGTTYTTMVNALVVYRYRAGWTAQQIFEYYYQRPKKQMTNGSTSSKKKE